MYHVGEYSIKQVQNVLLDILSEIDRLCRKNNIKYVLYSGTAIGAVRHKGFIPWDDDADVAMLREDYEKFAKIANQELSSLYRFECIENTHEYPYTFGKVRAVNTVFKETFTEKLNLQHSIYVDVLPMDAVSRFSYRLQGYLCTRITPLRYYKLGLISRKKRYIPFLGFSLRSLNKMNKLAMVAYPGKSDLVCKLCHYGVCKPPVSKSLFTDTIEVPFEDRMFFIPRDYHSYLSGRYGNYMVPPPEESRGPTHSVTDIKI